MLKRESKCSETDDRERIGKSEELLRKFRTRLSKCINLLKWY